MKAAAWIWALGVAGALAQAPPSGPVEGKAVPFREMEGAVPATNTAKGAEAAGKAGGTDPAGAGRGEGSEGAPAPEARERKRAGTLKPEELREFSEQPKAVQTVLKAALDAGDLGLPYKYAAAGPADGGFDCSGFLSYVLNGAGLRGVPRQANNFYVWVRKAGMFRAVVSRREDTFEMEELRPGDLLFWTGTYDVDRDPPVTHVMIYLGRRVADGKRVMAGASSGRRYEGEARDGGGVFDFWMPTRSGTNDTSRFIGYGAIPGLR